MSIGDAHRTVGVLPHFGDGDSEEVEMVRKMEMEMERARETEMVRYIRGDGDI
jgi:hypothetical protein